MYDAATTQLEKLNLEPEKYEQAKQLASEILAKFPNHPLAHQEVDVTQAVPDSDPKTIAALWVPVIIIIIIIVPDWTDPIFTDVGTAHAPIQPPRETAFCSTFRDELEREMDAIDQDPSLPNPDKLAQKCETLRSYRTLCPESLLPNNDSILNNFCFAEI